MLAIIKYWPVALSALISLFIGYNVGHYFGVKSGVKIEAGKAAKATVEKQEKYREIRNNRPDAATVIDSLRRGTF